MQIIPAIDLLDGRVVRLRQGDFERVQYYEKTATSLANAYCLSGAQWLHVVDLIASRDGEQADKQKLFELLAATKQQVQTGGGVRSSGDIEARLDAGASRVVVGSLAAENPEELSRWLENFGADVMVAALDVRCDPGGIPRVRTHGWKETSGKSLWDLLDRYSSTSLRHVLCTDISKDGLMEGPNVALYQKICTRYPHLQIQASGGVASLSDLEVLKTTGVTGVISGKALLDDRFTVEEAIQTLAASL